MSVAPVVSITALQVRSRASSVGSQSVICPPYPATAACFGFGELFGITIYAAIPRNAAARASAAAWLPEECVATPRCASASLRENTALHAPRDLNAPAFWRFSHLKNSF